MLKVMGDHAMLYLKENTMAEHIMHKKETKKAPKKSLKEKREDKKAKKKGKED
jgi:hypothetical protein